MQKYATDYQCDETKQFIIKVITKRLDYLRG